MAELLKEKREFIICADWNTCHQNIDLKNWRSNQKNSGFMPHEREWLTTLYEEQGWVDVFRQMTTEPDLYTGGPIAGKRGQTTQGGDGLYAGITRFIGHGNKFAIYRDERFSDHAPVTIDFNV